MTDLVIRFLVGGVVVSLFAALGDVLRPKSFAGLFGAAPSIALATLGLTIHKEGRLFAALEARTMIFGGLAFLAYAALASFMLRRRHYSALTTSLVLAPVWFGVAFGLLAAVRGSL